MCLSLLCRALGEAAAALAKEYSVDPEQDLNKLTDLELAKKKKVTVGFVAFKYLTQLKILVFL